MLKYDISIALPSIRTHFIPEFYEKLNESVGNYSYELIIVGPTNPNFIRDNVIYIEDYGNISRCVQIASILATGKYFTWSSDDAWYGPNALANCVDLFKNMSDKDGIIMRYVEGPNRMNPPPQDWCFIAGNQDNQRLPGIPADYPCAPMGMFNLDYYRKIGGLDCRFHHANMNAISLGYRIVKAGGKMLLSPDVTMWCLFDNLTNADHKILDESYHTNDYPLFVEMYKQPNDIIEIDYHNWAYQPPIWKRFK